MKFDQLNPLFSKSSGGIKKDNSLEDYDFRINDSVILKETNSQVQIKNLIDLPYLSNINLNKKTHKIDKLINSLDSLIKDSKVIKESVYKNLKKKKNFLKNIHFAQEISENLEKDIAEIKKKIYNNFLNSENKNEEKTFNKIEKEAKDLNKKRKNLYKNGNFRDSIKKINLEKDYDSFCFKISCLKNGQFLENKLNSSIFYKLEKKLIKIFPDEKKQLKMDLFNYKGDLIYYSNDENNENFLHNYQKTFSLLNFSKNKIKNNIIKKFEEKIKKIEVHNIKNLTLLNFEKKMSLYNLEKKTNLTDFIFEKEKNDIKIHPDGKLICTASNSLSFYDLCQKKKVLDFNNFFKKPNLGNIQFSNNGYYIGCQSENLLHIFDLRFCEKIFEIEIRFCDKYQFDDYGFDIIFLKDKKLCSKKLDSEETYFKSLIDCEDFYLSSENKFIFNKNFGEITQLEF